MPIWVSDSPMMMHYKLLMERLGQQLMILLSITLLVLKIHSLLFKMSFVMVREVKRFFFVIIRQSFSVLVLLLSITEVFPRPGIDLGSRTPRDVHCKANQEYLYDNKCCLNCPAGKSHGADFDLFHWSSVIDLNQKSIRGAMELLLNWNNRFC